MFSGLRYTLPVLLCLGLSVPASAQQGSAYIDQVTGAPASRGQAPRAGTEEALAALSANGTMSPNSQIDPGNAFLIPTRSAAAPGLGQVNNLAVLNQFGGSNTGTIDQTGTGNVAIATIIGSGNVTNQTQVGADSASTLNVLGDLNKITSAQNGDRNSYTLNVGGSSNTIAHTQNGNDLSFGLTVLGRNANIAITQAPSAGPSVVVAPAQATILPSTGRR